MGIPGLGIRVIPAFLCLLAFGAAADAACQPPSGRLDYNVLNEGSSIGWLRMDFRGNGIRTEIRTTIDVRVNFLFLIPILVYRHNSEEVWVNGEFRRYSGVTVDNGREHVVTVDAGGQALRVVKNGLAEEVEAAMLSRAVWCQETLQYGRLLSPLKGRLKEIVAEYLGEEWIEVGGRPLLTRHYAVTEDGRQGAVWYGEAGIVVKARFPTKHGTQMTLLLD